MKPLTLVALALTLASVATLGCDLRPVARPSRGVDLSAPLFTPMAQKLAAENPKAKLKLSPDEAAKAGKLLDEFLSRKDKAFELAETEEHLPSLERFFFQTGRFLELVDLYRDVYDNKGAGHYIAPRLAWAYTFMNRNDAAAKVLMATEKLRPNDPLVHLVKGTLIAGSGRNDGQALTSVRDSWKKVLELEPEFEGPMGFDASVVKARIKEIDQALAKGPVKQ